MIRTFRRSPPTVGVELEWQLVDRSTLELRDGILPLLEQLSDEPRIKPEMHQSAVETITEPRENTDALRRDLREIVGRLVDTAARSGMVLVGAGTHSFCDRPIPITPLPRYVAFEREQGYLARVQVTYALQAHVGMPSADAAVRAFRGLRAALPVLLALAASSPFFRGYETSFASYRHRILGASRTYGLPPSFEDWPAFLRFLDAVERARMFGSFRDMHWDARLRPDLGTIEVRVMDAQPSIGSSLALVALVHSLLVHLASSSDRPEQAVVPPLPWWIEKENAYRASRDGIDASLVCDTKGTVRPLRELAADVFALVRPAARALGEEADLARAEELLTKGPSERAQRRVFRRRGSTRMVVHSLANELLEELGRETLGPLRSARRSTSPTRPTRSRSGASRKAPRAPSGGRMGLG